MFPLLAARIPIYSEVLVVLLAASGLGVPGRRHGSGAFTGAFRSAATLNVAEKPL